MKAEVTATGRLLRKLPSVPRIYKVIAVTPDKTIRTLINR